MQQPPSRLVETAGITWSFSTEPAALIGVALGYRVEFAVDGFIVQANWLQNASDDNIHCAYLMQPAGVITHIAAWKPSAIAIGSTNQWVRRNIKPAWKVVAGTVYEFLVWRRVVVYAYAHNVLDSAPLTNGPITILRNNFDGASSAGLFDYEPPGDTALGRGEGTLYGVDLAFQPMNV